MFDRLHHARFIRRAARHFTEHDFLHHEMAAALRDRLADIKRDFPIAVEMGVRRDVLNDTIMAQKNIRTVIHAAPRADVTRADIMCDEEYLPLAPQSVDLIISVNHLHVVNDLPGTLLQMRRALKLDGLLLLAFIGGDSLAGLRHALLMTESELCGGASPRIAPMVGLQDLAALMQRADFALPVVDHDYLTVTYQNFTQLLDDLRRSGQSNVVSARSRAIVPRAFWPLAAQHYAAHQTLPDGRLSASVEIIYGLGWAPHNSQPQPKKRGSATTSLINILSSSTK